MCDVSDGRGVGLVPLVGGIWYRCKGCFAPVEKVLFLFPKPRLNLDSDQILIKAEKQAQKNDSSRADFQFAGRPAY